MNNKVLLTGVSGWIAKHTAIELLNSDYEVLGTVRNDSLIEQTKETINKHAPIDNLSFVELDLLKDDGWNEAAQGCKYIMHLASPFPFKVSNNRNSLLAPAVDGTLRVLNAGLNANIEQFIVTSSIAAMFRKPIRSNPYSFDENDWTDENWKEGVGDYFLSKTKAEKAAWELMESKRLKNKLTVINPGGVFGDALDKKGGTSIEYVKQFMKGKFPAAPKWGILISDVKDVAKAHVACIGNTKVGGRRLIVGKEVKKLIELSQIMAEAMPEYAKKLPKKELPNFMVKLISFFDSSAKTMIPDLGITMQTDTSYAEDLLGLKFNPAKGCISETAKSVVRLGLV
ncbi:dihydrokaempferol 4-reductase [Candidatus Pelagibacter sp. HTCC7211]|jgi:dihydroflavonol-4-reductase|uniref:NAD-dependent epimerase/dehydratase family protein n=1 Tax=Pelagibacter sp. (strain HTCC7211) TaxID=439493 RepID=UPI000183BE4A|nr:NAD-dependent epimerase/dehydratase family protein [Candidatus Pelagibacter sp. HTCC7211]EDZ59782.1 dihydrokaempferol 4-reductase [Candidatus Pelagibacter sp. HTCC7211]MBD1151569.1 NAD-dependent epimerase/dehydratase family protein [Pelagibacterales bacterium SAG-MED25]